VSELEYLKGAQKQKVTMRRSATAHSLACTDVEWEGALASVLYVDCSVRKVRN